MARNHDETDILPLVEAPPRQRAKSDMSSFDINTNPAVPADGTRYKAFVAQLDDQTTLRELIQFRTEMNNIFTGLNIQADAERKHQVLQSLMKGMILTTYQNGVQNAITVLH